MTRLLATLLAAVVAVALAAAAAAAHDEGSGLAASGKAGDEEAEASDAVEFVTNVGFDTPWPTGSVRASDSDFVATEVDPETVPQPGEDPPDGVFWYMDDMVDADYHARVEAQPERVFNVMGTYIHGMQIVDITDRDDPIRVAAYDCRVSQADVFTFEQTDDAGATRHYTVYSQDAVASQQPMGSHCHMQNNTQFTGERGSYVVELTDPFRPADRGFLEMAKGSHQITVHPDGEHVYNNASVLLTDEPGFIEVYDVSDIHARTPGEWGYEIVDVIDLTTHYDSHDMSFSEDGERAYSAAINHSFVIDSHDPTNNEVIARIYDPAINIHHDAHAIEAGDRTFMLIGDELAGAAGNAYCPGGGIHVYDITGELENAPVKVGAFYIPDVRPAGLEEDLDGTGESLTCTAHVIQPIDEHEVLMVAWFNAGVRLLDYSGLAEFTAAGPMVGVGNESITPGLQQVAWGRFPDSNLWSAKVFPGDFGDDVVHVYGGDTGRELDVWEVDIAAALGIVPEDDDAGRWMDPSTAYWHSLSVRSGLEERQLAGHLDHHKETRSLPQLR